MIFNANKHIQQTRDEIGSEPDTQPIVKVRSESFSISIDAIKRVKSTIGNSWIVGSSTNGLVGVNTATQGGGQQVVGGSGRVETLLQVLNIDKLFRENFNFSTFNDTGVTTATWSGGTLVFTSGQVAQSNEVAYNDGTVSKATISVTITAGVIGDLAIVMTADGGSNWESVSNNVEHLFSNTGTDLRFKITASGNVTLSKLNIQYG